MSSNSAANGHATTMDSPEILQPRARRAAPGSLHEKALATALRENDPKRSSEGPTPAHTPLPPSTAPPSVIATSSARRQIRSQRRRYPTVNFEPRLSYFDPDSDYANFRGFFVLFWIGLAIMAITAGLRNLKETGSVLKFTQWPLFTQDIYELALSDALMCASAGLSLPLHLLFKNSTGGLLAWNRGGIVVQSLYQASWLVVWCGLPFAREWTWTAQVFFTLHLLAILMKMHSYAFYNGHLSVALGRLEALDRPITPQTPTSKVVRYPTSYSRLTAKEKEEGSDEDSAGSIMRLRDDLAKELVSPLGNVTYPQNVTVANFCDYLLCPTLCYELEYPRTERTNPLELFYKTLAVFGCIFLMTVTSEEFILPVLYESQQLLQSTTPAPSLLDKGLIFAETVSRLLFPFMITFLLVFLSIFEYTLGAFAEITRFADRRFYSDWWNSLDWLEFSREWNIPVHHFFRRHVYSASRGSFSGPAATGLTFLVSALAHELVMGCITRKFRGYGFGMMMMQMPIVWLQRLPWVRERTLLNNVLFWVSMILGLSLMCALYVLV